MPSHIVITKTSTRPVLNPPIGAVTTRVTRFAIQVVVSTSPIRTVSRFAVQALALVPTPEVTRVTRFAIQVVVLTSPIRTVSRFTVQALAISPERTRVTRFAIQVVTVGGLHRQVAKFAVQAIGTLSNRKTLVPRPFPLPAPDYVNVNWRDQIVVITSWRTDVVKSKISASEDRRSLAIRPTRSIAGTLTGMTQKASTRLHASMSRRAKDIYPFPLYSDRSYLTQSSPALSKVIFCDTSYRRFFAGGRIAIFEIDSTDEQPLDDVAYYTISIVFSDRITLQESLFRGYNKFADVIPMIDANVSLDEVGSAVTDEHIELRFNVDEVLGPWTLPSLADVPGAKFDLFKGAFVFPQSVTQWGAEVNLGFRRQGSKEVSGRDIYVTVRGEVPEAYYSFTAVGLNRENVWKLLTFFDLVRGRAKHFYMTAPQAYYFEIDSWVSTRVVRIKRIGDFKNAKDVIKHIAFILKPSAGSAVHLNKVLDMAEFVDSFGNFFWDLLLEDVITFQTGDVDFATLAHQVRMISDSIVESWDTDGVCSVQFEMSELIDESNREILEL